MINPRLLWLLALLLCGFAAVARGQTPPAPAAPAAAPAAPSADELQRLVATLEDETARTQFIARLQTLIAAQRGLAPPPEEVTPVALLTGLTGELTAISQEIIAAAAVIVDAPRLVGWLEQQVSDAAARARWLEIGLHLAIIFAAALIADGAAAALLRRPARRLAGQTSESMPAQVALLALQLVLEALPIVVFAAAAYLVLPLVQPRFSTAHVVQVAIRATLLARLILVTTRVALLSPGASSFLPLGEETRNYLFIWVRRFTNLGIYGFAVADAAWWLGVPGAIYALVLRGTMLVLGIFAVIFVLQNRGAVADAVRGAPIAGDIETRGWRLLRHRLADTWHILAIVYIAGSFGSYVLRIEGGFIFVLRATAVSIIVLLAAWLLVRFVRRLSQRGFAISGELKTRFPTLETRANRYLPVLTIGASLIVYFFATLALLQAWGVNAFGWFDTPVGHRVAGSLLSILTVLLAALVVWELFGSMIERYLNGNGTDGQKVARSARARTLLPLLHTTMFLVLVTVVVLIVLSEIGVNIAPLLAGAGVIGLAVGFGSQALVKDVITGLFMLLEDTLAVGDVVDVGNGHSGVVEAISIRTIKLRDVAGTIHTVPFSVVNTVRNMTRDFSYCVADVGVLYREDPDRVIAVLRQTGDELGADPAWRGMILAPLEVMGVERFTDTAMVIRVRLKTLPRQQWNVAHEFNRRMKKAFDAAGIEMPSMNQFHYLGEAATPAAA